MKEGKEKQIIIAVKKFLLDCLKSDSLVLVMAIKYSESWSLLNQIFYNNQTDRVHQTLADISIFVPIKVYI